MRADARRRWKPVRRRDFSWKKYFTERYRIMHPALNQTARALRDLLFPPVCLNCGGLCESGSEGVGEGALQHICARCAPLVVAVRAPHCETCGHPFFGVVEGERMCPHCEGLRPRFGRAKT